jgi:hypothetical protein
MSPDLRLRHGFLQPLLATGMRRVAAMILAGLLVVIAAAGAVGVWAGFQGASAAGPSLTGMLPQGALLTIEARDFAGLLKRWNGSPEKTAWLKSDNYGVFSRSRLFGRLGDAQSEFAQAAGLPPDMSFLSEVAGSESVFAWYDVGKLEFLYITRMPSGSADKTRLVQMRGKFATRQIGKQTFYVRTQADEEQGGKPRTVAFATSGDWLLLATREDLMAGALTLMAGTAASGTGSSGTANSLAGEPWFVDARAASAKDVGDLRMTLNLEKIVPLPYFRSYWVQQNITEMKQYRSAVADLYTEGESFREERVLLPKSPQSGGASASNLAALIALLPQHAGVYRAVATPGVDDVVTTLNEKLIQRQTGGFSDGRIAPVADVAVHPVGSGGDLETRIDAAPIAPIAPMARSVGGGELAALRQALAASDLEAMMTVSRTNDAVDGIWVPFQSAVVLSSAKDWDAAAMQAAIQQALQARLTASGMGLAWKVVKTKAGNYFEISEARRLEIAVRGKLCILTDDPGLMQEMLGRLSGLPPVSNADSRATGGTRPTRDTLIAGLDLPRERASFARWSALVDRTNSGSGGRNGEPSFFSQNMRSLSDVFATLESEKVVERRDGALTRQTVTYAWRH